MFNASQPTGMASKRAERVDLGGARGVRRVRRLQLGGAFFFRGPMQLISAHTGCRRQGLDSRPWRLPRLRYALRRRLLCLDNAAASLCHITIVHVQQLCAECWWPPCLPKTQPAWRHLWRVHRRAWARQLAEWVSRVLRTACNSISASTMTMLRATGIMSRTSRTRTMSRTSRTSTSTQRIIIMSRTSRKSTPTRTRMSATSNSSIMTTGRSTMSRALRTSNDKTAYLSNAAQRPERSIHQAHARKERETDVVHKHVGTSPPTRKRLSATSRTSRPATGRTSRSAQG